jgi:DNA (cytosine-5)-methyltransferase 1
VRSLEIFSGAGGLAKGLALAGFEHCALVESNKHACQSLAENFDPAKVFFGDIKDFDVSSLGTVDVVAGGPPCQPFSLGGKHRANHDSRDMFPYAIRAIEQLTPKAFVFENVKGLLRESFADYFDYILLRLTFPDTLAGAATDWQSHLAKLRNIKKSTYVGTTYDVAFKLINAADYGIPQTRERVVIVGLRSDLGRSWCFPEPTHTEDKLLWEMHITGEYWKRHKLGGSRPLPIDTFAHEKLLRLKERFGWFAPAKLPWQTVRDALHDVPDARTAHGIADHIFKEGARGYAGHTGSDIDWPAKTIKAGDHGVPGGENMIRYEDGSVRYLTVFEAKRLQTFPDSFAIKGAWGEAMRQIGNAVPVALATVLGDRLRTTLAPPQKPAAHMYGANQNRRKDTKPQHLPSQAAVPRHKAEEQANALPE